MADAVTFQDYGARSTAALKRTANRNQTTIAGSLRPLVSQRAISRRRRDLISTKKSEEDRLDRVLAEIRRSQTVDIIPSNRNARMKFLKTVSALQRSRARILRHRKQEIHGSWSQKYPAQP